MVNGQIGLTMYVQVVVPVNQLVLEPAQTPHLLVEANNVMETIKREKKTNHANHVQVRIIN